MARTILVVDEQARVWNLVREDLESDGFRVFLAEDGRQALFAARQEKPDLILLDIMMPEVDGYEFSRRYRRERETPIIVLDARMDEMEQVLGNLVGNALRYTPPGGEILLIAGQENGNLRLVVQDTGSGIPADTMPFIFERSYRGDPSRSGSESGLGLAITRSIVELHGGTIRAESREGMGSRFILEFPSSTIA